jgi:hypothetical protein
MSFQSRSELLVKSGGATFFLYALFLVNPWHIYSYYLGIWWLMLPVILVAYRFSSSKEIPWLARPDWRGWTGIPVALLLFGIAIPMVVNSWSGKSIPSEPVELEFPLKGWRYFIAHGGSHSMINAHINVKDIEQYRGQTWAYDIVQMGWFGNRASGIYPRDLNSYYIFDKPVYAPCSGEILNRENNLADLTPPDTDKENLPGNYVKILCDTENIVVFLAHLKKGSVVVDPGDDVGTGDFVGRVGNSGNTSEPHLHIHAQKGGGGESQLNADPDPIVLSGYGFLTRNDIVRNR